MLFNKRLWLDVGSTSQLSVGRLKFTLNLLKSSKSSSEKNQSTCSKHIDILLEIRIRKHRFNYKMKFTLFNRLSTILHWCDMSVTIVTILSLEPLARTSVGPKTIAKFLASILLISLCSTIFFRCCIRYLSVSKWCSGKSRNSFRIVVILRCGSSILSASMNMGYNSAVSKESGSWRKNDFSNDDITLTSLHLGSWKESKSRSKDVRYIRKTLCNKK